ncbi:hypothetical protein C7Y71_002775 [Pseudoprevotella muciniphila]|uniref:DUF177 domain-containing protein n=1 Tax=Pseudoprevotella muciniphila TaxID=2133944 RepID=A0A5P8E552_9BACT|nr:YceD family protein [Pseudoprevotella muciniphila]QFQ12030.1 hypothetical protein C7Y71_002775 [Pseudoprevotella muciniphila]
MNVSDSLRIDLRSVSQADDLLKFHLSKDYFDALDAEDISDGSLDVSLAVRRASGDTYDLTFGINGYVVVKCDRCLDDLAVAVDVEEKIKVASFDCIFPSDDINTAESNDSYDIAWDIYEFVELSLPLKKIHPDGECNSEMVQLLESMSVSEIHDDSSPEEE